MCIHPNICIFHVFVAASSINPKVLHRVSYNKLMHRYLYGNENQWVAVGQFQLNGSMYNRGSHTCKMDF